MEREIEMVAVIQGPWNSMFFTYYGARNRVYEGLRFNQDFKGIGLHIRPSGSLMLGALCAFEDKIDYSHGRPASELMLNSQAALNISRNLHLSLSHTFLTLDVEGGRLFRYTGLDTTILYQFNRRAFFRATLQYSDVNQNQALYAFEVQGRSSSLFSQFLFSYKLNPRTVLFLGYTDNHLGTPEFDLVRTDRTLFLKIGYAWTI
jgi:hypothetical protein